MIFIPFIPVSVTAFLLLFPITIVFVVGIVLHVRKHYLVNIFLLGITLIGLLWYGVQWQTNIWKGQAQLQLDTEVLQSPAPGLLIPDSQTIPAGYVINTQPRSTFYRATNYQIEYLGPESNLPSPYDNILDFSEYKNDADSVESFYTSDKNMSTQFQLPEQDFTYLGQPGAVYSVGSSSTTTASYNLIWNDNNRGEVKIDAKNVPAAQYTPQTLITMLSSMVRSQ